MTTKKPTGRGRGRPPGVPVFARVERARDALAKKAELAVELVAQAATVAAKRGNHTGAAWMLEHIVAKNADGKEIRPIGGGVDRQQIEAGSRAPTINIGWVVGAPDRPALPVVDVKALPVHEDT
jgi:hypothetical protein